MLKVHLLNLTLENQNGFSLALITHLKNDHYYFNCIPDFGVSAAILNTIDISSRWCKLNFGQLRGQIKSCHYPERRGTRRQYFYFLYKFLGLIGTKRLGQPFWIMIWIYYYLLNGIRLDLDLGNSCWIRKIPKLSG